MRETGIRQRRGSVVGKRCRVVNRQLYVLIVHFPIEIFRWVTKRLYRQTRYIAIEASVFLWMIAGEKMPRMIVFMRLPLSSARRNDR